MLIYQIFGFCLTIYHQVAALIFQWSPYYFVMVGSIPWLVEGKERAAGRAFRRICAQGKGAQDTSCNPLLGWSC